MIDQFDQAKAGSGKLFQIDESVPILLILERKNRLKLNHSRTTFRPRKFDNYESF